MSSQFSRGVKGSASSSLTSFRADCASFNPSTVFQTDKKSVLRSLMAVGEHPQCPLKFRNHLGSNLPATLIRGASDSNPRSASCNLLRFTCSRAAFSIPLRAACSSLNRDGTLFAVITEEFEKPREPKTVIVLRGRARRMVLVLSILRVDKDRRQIAHDGQ